MGGTRDPLNSTASVHSLGIYLTYWFRFFLFPAVKDEPETIYAVLNGSHYNNRCCFDYGNAETDSHDDGAVTTHANTLTSM